MTRMTRNRTAAALCLYLLMCLSGRSQASWTLPDTIDNGDFAASSPAIAADQMTNGAMAVFVQHDGSINRVYAARYNPVTGWEVPVAISPAGQISADPCIVGIGGDEYIAAFISENSSLDRVYTARYTSGSWGPASLRDNAGYASNSPRLAAAGSNAMLVWAQQDATGYARIYSMRYTAGWNAIEGPHNPTYTGGNYQNCSEPAVALSSSGAAVIAYSLFEGSATNRLIGRFYNGATWETDTRLDTLTSLSPANSPAAAINGNNAGMIIFNQNSRVYWRSFSGATWGSFPNELASTGSININLTLEHHGGDSFMAAYALNNSPRPVYAASYGGISWSAPVQVSNGGGSAIGVAPALAVDTSSGKARLVWYEEVSSIRRIHASFYNGASWESAEIIDEDLGQHAHAPAAAWNGLHYLTLYTQPLLSTARVHHTIAYDQKVWDCGAANANWSDDFNWEPNEAPKPGDSVVFNSVSSAACALGASDTVRSVYLDAGYSGTFTFGASCSLFVTGNFDMSASAASIAGAGALCFAGAGPNLFSGNSSEAIPHLVHAGTGTLSAGASDFRAVDLTAAAGTVDLSAPSMITISGNVECASGATINASSSSMSVGGSWSCAGTFNHNSGTVDFNATTTGQTVATGGQPFYSVSFNGSGGAWSMQDALTATNLYLYFGTIDLGAGLSHTVDTIGTASMWGATLDFGSSTLSASGTVEMEALAGLTASSGSLVFTGTAQSFTPYASAAYPAILATSGATAVSGGFSAAALIADAASLDLSSATAVSVTDSIVVRNSGSLTAPSTLTIGGDFTIASGCTYTHSSGLATFDGSVIDGVIQTSGNTLYDVTINGGAGSFWQLADNCTVQNALTVTQGTLSTNGAAVNLTAGALTIDGGTLDCMTGRIDVNGAFTLSAGTLSAPASDTMFVGEGAFSVTGGTFTHNSGFLSFDNAASAGMSSSQPLGNVAVNGSGGRTLSGDISLDGSLWCNTAGVSAGIYQLTVAGAVSVDGGSLDGGSGSIRISGDLQGVSGSVTGTSDTIHVGGNWTFTGASFAHNSGTVALTGASSGLSITSNAQPFYTFVMKGAGEYTTVDKLSAANACVFESGLFVIADTLIASSTSIAGGTVDASSGRIDSEYGFFMTSGSLTAPSPDTLFIGDGGFSVTGGTFNHNNGVIVYDNPMGQPIECSRPLYTVVSQTSGGGRYLGADLTIENDLLIASGPFEAGSYALVIGGSCIVQGGTLNASTSNLSITDSLSISSGSVDLPGSANSCSLGGLAITGGTVTHNNGELTFQGSAAAGINPGGATFSTMRIAGQGSWTLAGALSAELLVIDSGSLALGSGLSHGVLDFRANGGSLDFGTSSLSISGSLADFDSLSGITSSGGSLELNASMSQSFRPANGIRFPHISSVGGSAVSVDGCGLTADSVEVANGSWSWGSSGYSHVLYGPLRCSGASMDFGTSAVHAGGDVDIGSASISSTSSTIFFTSSGAQSFVPNATTNPAIELTGAGTLTLSGNLSTPSFAQSAGTLNFNGKQLTTSGDLAISNGGSLSLAGLSGASLTIGGNATLSGQSGDLLNANPSSAWYLSVAGAASFSYAAIANCDASGGDMPSISNCTDGGGNVNFDFTAPSATIAAPSSGDVLQNLSSVSGSADDGAGSGVASVSVRIVRDGDNTNWDGASWTASEAWNTASGQTSWSFSSPSLSDGDYTLYARATDNMGTVQPTAASAAITIDQTAPSTTIDQPSYNTLVNTLPGFSGTAEDGGGSGISQVSVSIHRHADNMYWDGSQWSATQVYFTATGTANWAADMSAVSMSDGEYSFLARATDMAGNVQASATTSPLRFDTTAPTIDLLSPGGGASTSDASATYTLAEPLLSGTLVWEWQSGSEDAQTHQLTLSGEQLTTGDHTVSLPQGESLVNGAVYDYIITIADSAGNQTDDTIAAVSFDTDAAAASLVSPADSTDFADQITISFELPENATSGSVTMTCIEDATSIDAHAPHSIRLGTSYETAGSHTIALSPADLSSAAGIASVSTDPHDTLAEGASYMLVLSYRDLANNAGAADTVYAVRYDTTAPEVVLTYPPASSAIDNSDFIYTLSEKALFAVAQWEHIGGETDANAPHAMTLSGTRLEAGSDTVYENLDSVSLVHHARYRLILSVADQAGNTAIDTVSPLYADLMAATPALSAPGAGDTISDTVTITFTLPEPASSHSVALTFTESGTTIDTNDPHTITFSPALESAGEHTTTVYSSSPGSSPDVYAISANTALISGAAYDLSLTYADTLGSPADAIIISDIHYISSSTDTSSTDTSSTDTSSTDTASTDTASTDTSSADTSSADTASTDTASADTASADTASVDTTSADTVAVPDSTTSADTSDTASADLPPEAPTLHAPTQGDTLGDSVFISFSLATPAEPRSVRLLITEESTLLDPHDPHTVIFDSTFESAGTHETVLYGSAPGSSPGVYGVSPDAELVSGAVYSFAFCFTDTSGTASDTTALSAIRFLRETSAIVPIDTVGPSHSPDMTLTPAGDSAVALLFAAPKPQTDTPSHIIAVYGRDSISRTDSSWLPYADTTLTVMTPVRGKWIFEAALADSAGNQSGWVRDTLLVANHLPAITVIDTAVIKEDIAWETPLAASDSDGDSVSVTVVHGTAGVDYSGSLLRWTPANEHVGHDSIVLVADDAHGGRDTATVRVSVINVNDAPVIREVTAPDTVFEDDSVSIRLVVYDCDLSDSLACTIRSPEWLHCSLTAIDSVWSFTLTGAPGDADAGMSACTVSVVDRHGASAHFAGKIYVVDVNDAPQTYLESRRVAGGAVQYRLSARDDFDSSVTIDASMRALSSGTPRQLLSVSDNTFEAYPLADGSYAFEFYARDSEGLADPTPIRDTVHIRGALSRSFADTGEWTMLSIPGGAGAKAIRDQASLSRWDEQKPKRDIYHYYIPTLEIDSLQAGYGYWCKPVLPIHLTAGDIPSGPVEIALGRAESLGWNQIASPYSYPVAWPAPGPIWRWNKKRRDFEEIDGNVLEPWEAYWYRAEQSATIAISPTPRFVHRTLSKKATAHFASPREWRIRLSLQTSAGQDRDNLIGFSKRASNGPDTLDRFEPPRMSDFPALFLTADEKAGLPRRLARDIRGSEIDACGIFNIGIETAHARDCRLSIDGVDNLSGVYAWLCKNQTLTPLSRDTVIAVSQSEETQYIALITSRNRDLGPGLPLRFQTALPYPNPFSPTVHLRYTLPYQWRQNGGLSAARYIVTIDIYDIRGRLVRNLVNRPHGPGHFHTVWDGKANTGRRAAVGNYYSILTAGEFRAVHRLTIMR